MIKNIIIIILLLIILGLFIAPQTTKNIIRTTGNSIIKNSKDFAQTTLNKLKNETELNKNKPKDLNITWFFKILHMKKISFIF